MTHRFDPRAAWDALPPAAQRDLGAAALLLVVSADAGDFMGLPHPRRWDHAHTEAWRLLSAGAPDVTEYPDGPDLAALGIRYCRECGCTDHSACAEGCSWAEADLCSCCTAAPGARVAAHG
jgi:hypothetical protein